MIKARRTITAVCLATLMTATSFSTITPFPQTTITAEAASTISVEQAGKKIAKAQDKAFNTKKDVTVTVKVKCSKKKMDNIRYQINRVAAQAELGEAYNLNAKGDSAPMRASFYTKYGSKGSYDFKESLKGGVLTYKITIHGGNSAFQKAYKENSYLKQNVADLKKRVEGMDEKEKAWEVALWVNERSSYDYYKVDQSAEAVYKKKAYGACSALADMYYRYAVLAGVEKPGKVVCHGGVDHDWNCVQIDGETYYLDMQDVDSEKNGYEFYVELANMDNDEFVGSSEVTKETVMQRRGLTQEDLDSILAMSRGEYYLKILNEEIDGNSDYGKPSQWIYAGNFAKYFY